jgi:hypothetical protein
MKVKGLGTCVEGNVTLNNSTPTSNTGLNRTLLLHYKIFIYFPPPRIYLDCIDLDLIWEEKINRNRDPTRSRLDSAGADQFHFGHLLVAAFHDVCVVGSGAAARPLTARGCVWKFVNFITTTCVELSVHVTVASGKAIHVILWAQLMLG